MFVLISSVIGLNLKFPLCWLTLSVSQPSNFSSDALFLRCRLFCQRIFLGVYSPERICHFYFFHPYSTIIFSMFSLCYRERVRDGGRCFDLASVLDRHWEAGSQERGPHRCSCPSPSSSTRASMCSCCSPKGRAY